MAEEKELGELDKNLTPLLLFIPTPLLNPYCCIFQPPFITTSSLPSLGYIFNNYSSFVNPLLHLILCEDSVHICKIKKNLVSCHTVADKLLVDNYELWQLQKQRMKVSRDSFLARRILLIESCSTITQPKSVF